MKRRNILKLIGLWSILLIWLLCVPVEASQEMTTEVTNVLGTEENGKSSAEEPAVEEPVSEEQITEEESEEEEIIVPEEIKEEIFLHSPIEGVKDTRYNWIYENEQAEVYIKNNAYPEGEVLNLPINNITTSDDEVVQIIHDSETLIWSITTIKEGEAEILFEFAGPDGTIYIEQKVTVVCTHKVSVGLEEAWKLINQASFWLGRKESDGSHREIIDIYNSHEPLAIGYKVKYTDAWCATFVSAVSITCDFTDIIPTECGCQRMIALFNEIGCWQENEKVTPKQGWIIFYDWEDDGKGDNKGWADHVGIVEKVEDGMITVIEGNYEDEVKRREIIVNGKTIRGYGIPRYGKTLIKATATQNGYYVGTCADCGVSLDKETIYAASDISLSTTKYVYDGKAKKPSVTVKTSNGKELTEGKDYTVKYASGRVKPGKYAVKISFRGEYTGSKTVYFTIRNAAPSSVKAVLYGGYDDIRVTWTASKYADGYVVYYKKEGASKYTKLGRVKGTSYTIKNRVDGVKYTFKIVPYFLDGSEVVESHTYKTASVTTLKRMSVPSVKKYSISRVKISWINIKAESGYQISQSKTKSGTNIVATVSVNKTSKTLTAVRNRTMYYKVRAYRTVDGKRIYAPWSTVKAYRLK